MIQQEQIEAMASDMDYGCTKRDLYPDDAKEIAKVLHLLGSRKLDKDSIVLTRADNEMLKSSYDTQKGAIMTSSIGDLPLTVEGLRKTVDEITRLNRVETELQELNAIYYNEAKDLRRELKQARNETAKEIAEKLKNYIRQNEIQTTFFGNKCFINEDTIDELLKEYEK